jgi:hypothetical protein
MDMATTMPFRKDWGVRREVDAVLGFAAGDDP